MHGHHISGEQDLIPALVTNGMSLTVCSEQNGITHKTAALLGRKNQECSIQNKINPI